MMTGTEGEPGVDSFQVVVGTPSWFAAVHPAERYRLEVDRWDWPAIEAELRRRVALAEGDTWDEVAEQINQWAQWEFDNYNQGIRER